MLPPARIAEIGDAADVPQKLHALWPGQLVLDLGHLEQGFQRQDIIGVPRPGEPRVMRVPLKARDQTFGAAKLQVMVAPMEFAHRIKTMLFNRLNDGIVKRPRLAGDAKGAVFGMPPGAPGDLGQFLRVKLAHPVAVELGSGRKGDVLDVKIKPHANGIGGHQIIHIAVLIQSHLRVAGAG